MATTSITITGDGSADRLLSTKPLALLVGMVLDQQVPLEWAFRAPLELKARLRGPFTAAYIASMDPDELAALFSAKPALHRYPGSMAARVQALCQVIVDDFKGRPAAIWTTARSGDELVTRLVGLPGFGPQKARIFLALLGKQAGLELEGWRQASAPYGEPGSFASVADVVDADTLAKVRLTKAAAKGANAAGATRRATAAKRPASSRR
jgi:uncharacterized HhH-GPD family protein